MATEEQREREREPRADAYVTSLYDVYERIIRRQMNKQAA